MKCEHAGWTTRTTNMTREAPQSCSTQDQDTADNWQVTDRARLVCLWDRHAFSSKLLTVHLGTRGCHIWLTRHHRRTSYCSARYESGSRRSMYQSSQHQGVRSRPSTRTCTAIISETAGIADHTPAAPSLSTQHGSQ